VPLTARCSGVVRPGTTSDVPVTTLAIAARMLHVAAAPGPRELVWHYPHYSNQGKIRP
jgi:hypothetical protein